MMVRRSREVPLSAGRVMLDLGTQVVGRRVVCLHKTSSTMDVAREEAEKGAPEGTVVTAEQQTSGRGRFKRAWLSRPGEDLLFSVVFRPRLAQLPALNMAATLAVVRTVAKITGAQPTIKWPNDVRVGGKKLCGILLEDELDGSQVRHAVVGVGLNVNMDPTRHREIAETATSMAVLAGSQVSRLLALRTYLQELDRLYLAVKSDQSLYADWRANMETLGKRVQVRWQDSADEGLAEDVNPEGNLLLRKDDGSLVTLVAGEVTLQR
jgi:BirA family biotin operon repressor/biotin-[acetyl-CoA-carboxylase] ligase